MPCITQFLLDASDFLFVFFRSVGLIENVILLVFKVYASKAILEVAAVRTELTVLGVIGMNHKVAVVAEWSLHTLVGKFGLKANSKIAAVFVSVGFNVVETVFRREDVEALIATFAF